MLAIHGLVIGFSVRTASVFSAGMVGFLRSTADVGQKEGMIELVVGVGVNVGVSSAKGVGPFNIKESPKS
jgi:hypothetical protein